MSDRRTCLRLIGKCHNPGVSKKNSNVSLEVSFSACKKTLRYNERGVVCDKETEIVYVIIEKPSIYRMGQPKCGHSRVFDEFVEIRFLFSNPQLILCLYHF